MRINGFHFSALATVVVAAVLSGCGRQSATSSETPPTSAHDATYYAQHIDEAKARDVACNKSKLAGESFSPEQDSDCAAARKAAHEANNAVYVPGNGKPFSSAGGKN